MDIGGFSQLGNLMQRAREASGQLDVPVAEYMSFIPGTQHSNVVLMKSHKPMLENMTTLFMGSIRKNYTLEMWEFDCKQWTHHLGNQRYFFIPILPHDTIPDACNSRDAIVKIENAMKEINQLPPGEKIRLIVLGTGQAGFFTEAITYLLREWKTPDGRLRTDKYMQFITSGDTGAHDLNNFCQWLCIAEICDVIEFYNTMHYHPFGFCSKEYSAHK